MYIAPSKRTYLIKETESIDQRSTMSPTWIHQWNFSREHFLYHCGTKINTYHTLHIYLFTWCWILVLYKCLYKYKQHISRVASVRTQQFVTLWKSTLFQYIVTDNNNDHSVIIRCTGSIITQMWYSIAFSYVVFVCLVDEENGTRVQYNLSTDRNSLEILIFDELYDDVLFRLNLKHLQSEAEERSGLDVSTINSTNILQLHSFVHNQLSCGGQNMHTLDLH